MYLLANMRLFCVDVNPSHVKVMHYVSLAPLPTNAEIMTPPLHLSTCFLSFPHLVYDTLVPLSEAFLLPSGMAPK